jgi:hypothetical protein
MRTITTHVYTLDELSPDARETAIEQLREHFAGPWWDDHDTASITEVIFYTLAEKFHTPGWDTYGVADFPGIPGVAHTSWSLDRDRHLALYGYLDRHNAPGLPWVDGIDQATLTAEREGTTVTVIDTEPDCTCPDGYLVPHDEGCPQIAESSVTDEQRTALDDAVTDAIHEALMAGEKEMEYKTSAEYAEEMADGHEFTEDGHLYE